MHESYEVEISNVTKRFGEVTAVDSVSLRIRSGEFITLLGPSGCGKTTLLRMIAGFELPDDGRVVLGGRDATDLPPYRRDVTTVFQQYALFPHLDVFGNIAFGLERRRVARDECNSRVRAALEMVRLGELGRRYPAELSGGQQQRVALARALVLEPKVLLLDEPLAALDLKLRKEMQIELKGLQRRLGISFVYVTHDQEEALTMSDRIAVMNAGRIEQTGRAEEIYERPRTQFVAGFIGQSNIVEVTVASVADGQAIITLGGATLRARGDGVEPGERALLMIRPEKIRIAEADSTAALVGKIDSIVYLGESTQWKVLTEGGRLFTVLEQNHNPFESVSSRIGQVVGLSWEPSSAIILKG